MNLFFSGKVVLKDFCNLISKKKKEGLHITKLRLLDSGPSCRESERKEDKEPSSTEKKKKMNKRK